MWSDLKAMSFLAPGDVFEFSIEGMAQFKRGLRLAAKSPSLVGKAMCMWNRVAEHHDSGGGRRRVGFVMLNSSHFKIEEKVLFEYETVEIYVRTNQFRIGR